MSFSSRILDAGCALAAVFAGLAVSSFSGTANVAELAEPGATAVVSGAETAGQPMNTSLPDVVVAALDARRLPAVSGPRQSDLFPDVPLVDHTGQEHLFRTDLTAGKVLCFAMFYTRCDGSCPGTIAKMLRLRRSLTQEFGRENLHFVCLTLDPVHDQPQVLRHYAGTLGVDNQHDLAPIYFCTGRPENVETVRRALGMYDPDPVVDADISQHAAKIVFGNDLLNRWSGMPAGLPIEDLHETALRIAGTSDRQKFSSRLAIDGRRTP
ncbi:MAG: SCO family protein [Planctomycetota bacterium]